MSTAVHVLAVNQAGEGQLHSCRGECHMTAMHDVTVAAHC